MNKEKLFVFDICGTLYHSNTTYDFLKFYFRRTSFSKYMLCQILLSFPAKLVVVALGKLGNKVALRSFLIAMLRGEKKHLVENKAKEFVSQKLDSVKNSVIHKALEDSLRNRERVMLVSATIEPVAKAISSHLQVRECYATLMETQLDEIYSGRILKDLKGGKLSFLKGQYPLTNFELYVYTDNFDDLPLIQEAKFAQIVSKTRWVHKWERLLRGHFHAEIIHV